MNIILVTLFCCLLGGVSFFAHGHEVVVQTPKILILLGPPGSGKGTQAVRLSKEMGIPHISTGDLFRDNLRRDTELGKRAKGFMESGKLVPDELVLEMLFERVSRSDCLHGYLLDGFPRTIHQAEALDQFLAKDAKVIALNLRVDDSVIIKRAEGRLTCEKCGAIYNRYFSPPLVEGVCDKCYGHLIQRADDRAAVVEERLKVYHLQTEPVIHFYEKKGLILHVNGEHSPDAVFNELIINCRMRLAS